MPSIIQTHGLTRTFAAHGETVEAVRGLDLEVQQGELVAFLGPNGAGKSTSLRMLTTLLPPTAGEATVVGHDIRTDAAGVRRKIGYIGQGNGAGHTQRARDELVCQGQVYGLSASDARARADDLLDSLDLAPLATRTVSTLSGGQRRRLDVALGLVHRPQLLFLDEPSTGLDPQNRANLAAHIRQLRDEHGTTIFFTTHYLEEADQLAERVIVVDHGKVIADDRPEVLKARLAGDRVTITLGAADQAGRAAEVAAGAALGAEIERDNATLRLRVDDGPALLPDLIRALDRGSIGVRAIDVRRPTLDDVFLALTGRSLRETNGN
jgi:ABC-2 type transport system ATP-binding protein